MRSAIANVSSIPEMEVSKRVQVEKGDVLHNQDVKSGNARKVKIATNLACSNFGSVEMRKRVNAPPREIGKARFFCGLTRSEISKAPVTYVSSSPAVQVSLVESNHDFAPIG